MKFVDAIQKVFFKDEAGGYEDTVKSQLKAYLKNNKFNTLEERERWKTILLHTDRIINQYSNKMPLMRRNGER